MFHKRKLRRSKASQLAFQKASKTRRQNPFYSHSAINTGERLAEIFDRSLQTHQNTTAGVRNGGSHRHSHMATEVRSRNSDALQCFESSSPLVIGGKFATSTPISVVTQQPIVAKTRDSANKGTNISTSEKRNTPPSRHNAATSVEPLAQPSTPKQQAPDSATETKTTMINETGKENKEGKKITKSNTILPKIAKTKEDESISVLCSLRMAANCSRFQPQVRQERAAQETLIQLVDEVPAAGKKNRSWFLKQSSLITLASQTTRPMRLII